MIEQLEAIEAQHAELSEKLASPELLADPKETAEHVMLLDLGRNDLGRVARPGGVRLERSPHVVDLDYVHHLLAVVAADLKSECDLSDLLRATFPAGSITGAPKIAAMRLIDELEVGPRGPYCGSFGWAGYGADGYGYRYGYGYGGTYGGREPSMPKAAP